MHSLDSASSVFLVERALDLRNELKKILPMSRERRDLKSGGGPPLFSESLASAYINDALCSWCRRRLFPEHGVAQTSLNPVTQLSSHSY